MFINFKSVENIRDLGGIKTIDGHIIKPRLLLRSADLHNLTSDELSVLKEKYNLKVVVDFRSTKSSTLKKDKIDSSIEYHHIFALKELEKHSYTKDITCTPDEFFLNVYHSLAVKEEAINTYKKFLGFVLDCKSDAILYHCTSGKDRTGIATILLLYILGCSKETIYEEHFETNKFTRSQYEETISKIENLSEKEKDYYEAFYIAKKIYIDEYFRSIEEKYSSFPYFVKEILGIDEEKTKILRDRYLEK